MTVLLCNFAIYCVSSAIFFYESGHIGITGILVAVNVDLSTDCSPIH